MHTNENISFGSFVEDSINYQNEDVYIMYGIIFLVLTVICISYYQYSKFVNRRGRKLQQKA
ncbi:MAG: hypothetical protein Q9M12_03225 [Mariprofundus sp.]|nr:hypothetical protein [Mariprofundus sp.]